MCPDSRLSFFFDKYYYFFLFWVAIILAEPNCELCSLGQRLQGQIFCRDLRSFRGGPAVCRQNLKTPLWPSSPGFRTAPTAGGPGLPRRGSSPAPSSEALPPVWLLLTTLQQLHVTAFCILLSSCSYFQGKEKGLVSSWSITLRRIKILVSKLHSPLKGSRVPCKTIKCKYAPF